jgi:hypothetical protein
VAEKSRLRRSISRWANSSDMHARDMLRTYTEHGEDTIADAQDRARVRLRGTLRTVTLRPRGGVPALEAELFDGSGALTIIWLGRRRIVGIDPGVSISVEGRIGVHDGQRVIFNPRYELLA